ncbi:MAG TPA: hypothetical protein DCE39_04255 [Planctomycetaceae bacterium]|nr:hypothetical protein [Planctomycetaceae bacterium]
MTEFYGHRGSILWTKNNTIIITRNRRCRTIEERRARGRGGAAIEVQIRLDSGRTWVASDSQRSVSLGQGNPVRGGAVPESSLVHIFHPRSLQ